MPEPRIGGRAIEAGLRTILIDRVTVEVHQAFAADGIPSILLKGPAIARWLYEPDEVRGYGDSDLLVPHRDWVRATQALRRLGFQNGLAEMAHPNMESIASDAWYRGADNLDLHSTFFGIDAPPEAVWPELEARTVTIDLDGHDVPVLAPGARAMHVALHAAQHQYGKAVHDLERAVARLPDEVWEEALVVARRLLAEAAFAAGLKMVPGGPALSDRLQLGEARTIKMDLRAGGVPLSESLNYLWDSPGIKTKLRVAFAEILPNPSFMRWWSPLAQRGRLGLALAYAWRPIYLLVRGPSAIRAVWRARRGQASESPRTPAPTNSSE